MGYDLGEIRELIDKALTDRELADLCFDYFQTVYNDSGGQARSKTIRSLVEYAARQNKIKKLLESIEKLNLNRYLEYKDRIGDRSDAANRLSPLPKSELFQASNFDLKDTIGKCLKEIITNQQLVVGLSVRYSDSAFRRHLADRLQKALGKKKTKVRTSILLNSKSSSIGKAVEKILTYQDLLDNYNVICPVIVDIADPNSTSVEDFWLEVQTSFIGKFNRQLIIMMFGRENCILPSNVMLLDPPIFNYTHAFEWFIEVTDAVESPAQEQWEEATKVWKEKMMDVCRCEHPDLLEVNLVYDHLHNTLDWIRVNQSLPIEDFKKYLNS
jgi:hypothetical protein